MSETQEVKQMLKGAGLSTFQELYLLATVSEYGLDWARQAIRKLQKRNMKTNSPLDGFRISKTQKALLTAHPASWESGAIGSVRGLVAQGLAEITGVAKQGGNKTLKYRILPGAGEACRAALRERG